MATDAFFGIDEYDAGILKGTPNIGECPVVRLSRTSFKINNRTHRNLGNLR